MAIKHCVEDKKILVNYVKTEDRLVNILTKSLGRLKFVEMQWRGGSD
ncbi:unnamed protein product [Spirodela intermedia]|uniref:Uncharacterized protein n=1 Tax=Spirodela intermedia TaxID=51605 RepID=A0A7I8LCQ1_SPIIN|nr:unnamed protein product [Spirodela intermedia]